MASPLATLAAGVALILAPSSAAVVQTLKSTALQLEVTTSPFSFRVLEVPTGKVIVAASALAFSQKRVPAATASGVTKTATALRAKLQLAGSGDEAQVSFTFTRPDVIRVVLSSAGAGEIFQEFLDQGEHYYGIWEHPFGGSIDNRGADREFAGFGGLATVINPNARAPFYVTSNRYGIYVQTVKQGRFTVASNGKTSFSFKDSELTYHILYGRSYADIFQRYNAIAGGSVLPPLWALDSIWWRDDYHQDLRGVANAQEKVIDDAENLIRNSIPASTIWIDRPYGTGTMGWGNVDFDKSFPDPAKMIKDLEARGYNQARKADDTTRKYAGIWNGDTRASFEALAMSVKQAQRSGAMNFPMWGSDTGGYTGSPDEELFARWLQFSAYSTLMEVLLGPKRTIWMDYDDELVAIARDQATAHHDLMPYSRSYLYQATRTGMPVMRSLVFAYPDDSNLHDLWDEYLFGGEILVAPVLSAGAASREVYLPAGRWLDYNDKTTIHNGGAKITAQAPLATIPLFVREGAIIPRGDIWHGNGWWLVNWSPRLRIEVFPAAKGASRFDYYTGALVRRITATTARGGITVSFSNLGAGGTLEVYCQNVKRVVRNGAVLREGTGYTYDAATKKLSLRFTGAVNLSIQGAASIFGL